MMWLLGLCWLGAVVANWTEAPPAARQIADFAREHKKPIGVLTTSWGAPVDIRQTSALNSELFNNDYFLDSLRSAFSERIPERVVHAKGISAFGYFEVTHDVSKYTKIEAFNGIGKKTPVNVRFSPNSQRKGGSDLDHEVRGLAIKFYTQEGNFDLLNLQVPVFFTKEPNDFAEFNRVLKRNPKTSANDFTTVYDFITLRPSAAHQFLWVQSDYGLPRGYRKMDAFAIHAFEIYNEHGDVHYARFVFKTNQGLDNFTNAEAMEIKTTDLDYFMRDLYNAIGNGNYPSWNLEMHVIPKSELKHLDFDPFDLTSLWPKGGYRIVPVGRLVLNRNVKNHFAQVEQSAFSVTHLVPGITGAPDIIFSARRFSYPDSIRSRLGINFNKINVNLPWYSKTYNRDGKPPIRSNMEDAPNYYPNTYHGPIPYVDKGRPSDVVVPKQNRAVDLRQANYFYNHILKTEGERQRLAETLGTTLVAVDHPVQERALKLFRTIDEDLGRRVEAALEVAEVQAKVRQAQERARNEAVAQAKHRAYYELEEDEEDRI